jgi:phosphopentomutase
VWNKDLPFSKPVYPNFPTVFEMAKAAGYTTAIAAGKSKFAHLLRPKTVDWFYVPEKTNTKVKDKRVAEEAIKLITQNQPDVMFVHFPEDDSVGHLKGWGSAEQLALLQQTDGALARVLTAWRQTAPAEQSLIILNTDHGGQGKVHGSDDPRSRNVPWIAVGPGFKKDYDLAAVVPEDPVRIEDTFATALDWLKVKITRPIDGQSQLPWLAGKKLKQVWIEVTPTGVPVPSMSPEHEVN